MINSNERLDDFILEQPQIYPRNFYKNHYIYLRYIFLKIWTNNWMENGRIIKSADLFQFGWKLIPWALGAKFSSFPHP